MTVLNLRQTSHVWRRVPTCQQQTTARPLQTRGLGLRAPKGSSPHVAELLTKYGQQSPRPLTLSTLLSFGRPLTADSVLSSASYALAEIPRRLTRRIRSLENLPFIVGTNPFVARTLQAYRMSFEQLATYSQVTTLRENADFAAQLEHLVQSHANDIPTMAKGYALSSPPCGSCTNNPTGFRNAFDT